MSTIRAFIYSSTVTAAVRLWPFFATILLALIWLCSTAHAQVAADLGGTDWAAYFWKAVAARDKKAAVAAVIAILIQVLRWGAANFPVIQRTASQLAPAQWAKVTAWWERWGWLVRRAQPVALSMALGYVVAVMAGKSWVVGVWQGFYIGSAGTTLYDLTAGAVKKNAEVKAAMVPASQELKER